MLQIFLYSLKRLLPPLMKTFLVLLNVPVYVSLLFCNDYNHFIDIFLTLLKIYFLTEKTKRCCSFAFWLVQLTQGL